MPRREGARTVAWDPKAEAVRLWDHDPCGAVAGIEEGSVEFFKAVDRDRYSVYAPWLIGVVGFSDFARKRVLEVGCGMGSDLAQFMRGGAIACGIDLVPRHLSIAAARLRIEGSPVRLIRSDAEHLPVRADCLDVVYSFGALHHTPSIERALEEIHRALRPGGELILGVYHRHSFFYLIDCLLIRGIARGRLLRHGYRRLVADVEWHPHTDALPLVRLYTRGELRRLLRAFRELSITVHHLPRPRRFRRLDGLFKCMPDSWFEEVARRWGWYLLARARK